MLDDRVGESSGDRSTHIDAVGLSAKRRHPNRELRRFTIERHSNWLKLSALWNSPMAVRTVAVWPKPGRPNLPSW
jgi:hypothetical protein